MYALQDFARAFLLLLPRVWTTKKPVFLSQSAAAKTDSAAAAALLALQTTLPKKRRAASKSSSSSFHIDGMGSRKTSKKATPLVGAIDQGTSSSRFLVFDPRDASVVSQHQVEFESHYPQVGWVEHDPWDLLNSVKKCMVEVHRDLEKKGLSNHVMAVGITNQRETTVVWDRHTGMPLYKALVWLDARTQITVDMLLAEKAKSLGKECLRPKCGLPLSTYFSAVKLRWLLDHVSDVSKAADEGRLCFGTVDSWLIWNLTAEKEAKERIHVTDVTNASRTMLMNLHTLQWDEELLNFFGVKEEFLPKIVSSSEEYGLLCFEGSPWPKIPISGCLGDQQAALVGQRCLSPGMAKNTYGTGCFMLYNVGHDIVVSTNGMLSTVAYKLGANAPAVYALEGSIAIAGAAVKWLRDNLEIIKKSEDVEKFAAEVEDSGGVYFVPAFSGLFAPHWRPDARGIVCGLTHYTRKQHLCRATLEAVCFQTREIVEAMNKDSGLKLEKLLVDGGMTNNNMMMQMQADFLGINVVRPSNVEATALGAAMAAGRAIGVWNIDQATSHAGDKGFSPAMPEDIRDLKFHKWTMAVERSLGWEDGDRVT